MLVVFLILADNDCLLLLSHPSFPKTYTCKGQGVRPATIASIPIDNPISRLVCFISMMKVRSSSLFWPKQLGPRSGVLHVPWFHHPATSDIFLVPAHPGKYALGMQLRGSQGCPA